MTIPNLDPSASDSQKWSVVLQFMQEFKGDLHDMERRIEMKFDSLAGERRREAFDRGTVTGRIESLEGQLNNERKDRLDLAKKHEKLQFWLLTLTAAAVVQVVLALAVSKR